MTVVQAKTEQLLGEIVSGPTETGIVLEGVSCETYHRLLAGIGDRRVFVTYDSGTMEIQPTSPSNKHESVNLPIVERSRSAAAPEGDPDRSETQRLNELLSKLGLR